MASLYELTGEYEDLIFRLEEAGSEEESAQILEALDALDERIEDRAEIYARIIRNKQSEAEGLKAEADRLTKRRQSAENTAEKLKARLLDTMTRLGKSEIATAIGKWKVQNNPWSVEVLDLSAIDPEWLIEQPPKVDRAAMLKHFKATGEVLSGVEFRQGVGLRFR